MLDLYTKYHLCRFYYFQTQLFFENIKDEDAMLLQELYKKNYKKLEQQVNISHRSGRYLFSNPPNRSEHVVTSFYRGLHERVLKVKDRTDRILNLVVRLAGRTQTTLVNCNARNPGKREGYFKKFLVNLIITISYVSNRRFTIIGVDLNAQMSRNFKDTNGKYDFSNRSNRNRKIQEEWIVKRRYEVFKLEFKIGEREKETC
eukprot:snap_masked-scaffold_17-processed-gene-1.18-mRNA-1 protein AED:1.00 eAED:1.00 QI:0/-1/0/0/-1/1/1/0/201